MTDEEVIVVNDSVVLERPDDDTLAYIESTLRPGDKMEHDFFGGSLKCPEGHPSWVVRCDGDVMGVGGFTLAADGSYMSGIRIVWFLSCTDADRHKVAFVRYSRKVLAEMCRRLPSWVDTIIAVPMSDYRMSVRWLERVMRMRPCDRIVDQYCEFTVMIASRKELENV